MKNLIFAGIRIFLGAVFIFSAISKLFPIEIFELNFVYAGLANWSLAPWLARILIALEALLGICFIINYRLKKFTLPAAIFLLFLFTVYLLYSIVKDGNTGNCGCFGTLLPMTPLESVFKNIVMVAMAIMLYFRQQHFLKVFQYKWVPIATFAVFFGTLLIAFPVTFEAENTTYDSSGLKNDFLDYSQFNGAKETNLREGYKIVAFFSLGCDHCKEIAMKLAILNKRENLPPIYYIFVGSPEDIPGFVGDTKSIFPYKLIDIKEFVTKIGSAVPRVIVLINGKMEKEWFYKNFDNQEFIKYFQNNFDKSL